MSATPNGTGGPHWWTLDLSWSPVSARYWRFRFLGGSGVGDSWLMLHRLHLFGT